MSKAHNTRKKLQSSKCRSFRKQFRKPQGIARTIKKQATVFDTLHWMSREKIPSELSQTKQYAAHLARKSSDIRELCILIWNDLFGCTRYKFDELGYEQVRSPERLVHDVLGDCDCFVSFMSSVLSNLKIPHLLRMTAYEKDWQHIYVIVPTTKGKRIFDAQHPQQDVLHRREYICLDPVIEAFDREKAYKKKFDAMPTTLQSLEGLGNTSRCITPNTNAPISIHAARLQLDHSDQGMGCACSATIPSNELGFLKLKKTFDKLGKTKIGQAFRKVRDKAKTAVGNGIKFVNRFANPATILLRNGVLLGMKINMMKVAQKLRFGYLSETELRRRGFNESAIQKLKKAIDKIQKVYKGAGGKNENLRKAILEGKGNRDGKVPKNLSGLGEETSFVDPLEAMIILRSPEQLEAEFREDLAQRALGEVTASAALAAASSVLAAIAAILKEIRPPQGEQPQDWDVSQEFSQEAMNHPDVQAILNNPESFDPSIAQRAGINMTDEQLLQTAHDTGKGGNKTLLIGLGVAAVTGGLLYLNQQSKSKGKGLSGTKTTRKPKRKASRSGSRNNNHSRIQTINI